MQSWAAPPPPRENKEGLEKPMLGEPTRCRFLVTVASPSCRSRIGLAARGPRTAALTRPTTTPMRPPPRPLPHAPAMAASRRVVLHTLLGALATSTSLPQAVIAASGGTAATTSVYSVASAALDPRSYRALILANGLRVLLASDPNAAKVCEKYCGPSHNLCDPSACSLSSLCSIILHRAPHPWTCRSAS